MSDYSSPALLSEKAASKLGPIAVGRVLDVFSLSAGKWLKATVVQTTYTKLEVAYQQDAGFQHKEWLHAESDLDKLARAGEMTSPSPSGEKVEAEEVEKKKKKKRRSSSLKSGSGSGSGVARAKVARPEERRAGAGHSVVSIPSDLAASFTGADVAGAADSALRAHTFTTPLALGSDPDTDVDYEHEHEHKFGPFFFCN